MKIEPSFWLDSDYFNDGQSTTRSIYFGGVSIVNGATVIEAYSDVGNNATYGIIRMTRLPNGEIYVHYIEDRREAILSNPAMKVISEEKLMPGSEKYDSIKKLFDSIVNAAKSGDKSPQTAKELEKMRKTLWRVESLKDFPNDELYFDSPLLKCTSHNRYLKSLLA